MEPPATKKERCWRQWVYCSEDGCSEYYNEYSRGCKYHERLDPACEQVNKYIPCHSKEKVKCPGHAGEDCQLDPPIRKGPSGGFMTFHTDYLTPDLRRLQWAQTDLHKEQILKDRAVLPRASEAPIPSSSSNTRTGSGQYDSSSSNMSTPNFCSHIVTMAEHLIKEQPANSQNAETEHEIEEFRAPPWSRDEDDILLQHYGDSKVYPEYVLALINNVGGKNRKVGAMRTRYRKLLQDLLDGKIKLKECDERLAFGVWGPKADQELRRVYGPPFNDPAQRRTLMSRTDLENQFGQVTGRYPGRPRLVHRFLYLIRDNLQ